MSARKALPPIVHPAAAAPVTLTTTAKEIAQLFIEAEVVDLFAGPGGWDVWLKANLIKAVGIEWDRAACETRVANDLPTIQGDVRIYGPADFPNARMLIASPPCQTFSMAGKGAGRAALDEVLATLAKMADKEPIDFSGLDERTALVLDPLRWILEAYDRGQPFECVALEQVPTVLPVWQAYAEVLRELGYEVDVAALQAEQFGVPQTRKRAVLVARYGAAVSLPTPTHSRYYSRDPMRLDGGVLPWISMAQALGDGYEGGVVVSNYGSGGDPKARGERTADQPAATVTSKVDRNKWKFVANDLLAHASHRPIDAQALGDLGVEQIRARGAGAGERRPREINEPSFTVTGVDGGTSGLHWVPVAANEGTTAEDMEWSANRPSPTIVGSFAPDVVAAPGYRGPGDGPRQKAKGSVRVTAEEAAALQTFPPNYVWKGSKSKVYQQIGNAIPPVLAGAIIRAAIGDR